MERSIWIVKVPREEERLGGEEQQLGGAVKERTEGVERQVAALICRKRASRDKRRTTSARFGVAALACRVSPSIPTGTVAEEKRKRPPSATRVKAAETCRTLTLARTGNQHQVI